MPSAFVYNAATGAQVAAARGQVTVVVDALRASGTITTLLAHGAERVIVLAEPHEALAVREALVAEGEEVMLVGERGGVRVQGFDRGNEPVVAPTELAPTCLFTSSNFAYCCLAAREAPVLLVGTTINAAACARAALRLAVWQGSDVALVMAGFSEDQTRLNLEDLLACGCLLERLGLPAANDTAKAALYAFRYLGVHGLAREFRATEHGAHLVGLARGDDISFLCLPDQLETVGTRRAVLGLAGVPSVELAAED